MTQARKKRRKEENPDILEQGVQAMASRPNPACSLFFYGPPAKNGLYIFIWLKKKFQDEYFLTHTKYMKFSFSVHRLLLKHSHAR